MDNTQKFLLAGYIACCALVMLLAYSLYAELPPCFVIGPGGAHE